MTLDAKHSTSPPSHAWGPSGSRRQVLAASGEHLPLERGISERHARQMREIDRTVIGGERRRWHPFDPLCAKRHVGEAGVLSSRRGQHGFDQPNTEMVNGTFDVPAHSSPCFRPRVAAIRRFP